MNRLKILDSNYLSGLNRGRSCEVPFLEAHSLTHLLRAHKTNVSIENYFHHSVGRRRWSAGLKGDIFALFSMHSNGRENSTPTSLTFFSTDRDHHSSDMTHSLPLRRTLRTRLYVCLFGSSNLSNCCEDRLSKISQQNSIKIINSLPINSWNISFNCEKIR